MDDPSKFEADLWEAADNLRANSKLTVPSGSPMRQLSGLAKTCFAQSENTSLQNQKIRAARDLLLPQLMSGEIEV